MRIFILLFNEQFIDLNLASVNNISLPTATKADDDKPTESDIEGGGGGGNDAANEDGAPPKVPSEVKENLSHDDDPVREDPPEEDRVSDHNDPLPDKEKDKEMEEKVQTSSPAYPHHLNPTALLKNVKNS